MTDQLHIVSLGSSFAAGPGIHPQDEPPAARRSIKNYPHLLASSLNAKLTDLTSSGATLLNITTESQSAPFSKVTFPPQISKIPNDVDIITITAGGDDLGYIGGIFKDVWNNAWYGKAINFFIKVFRGFTSLLRKTPSDEATGDLSPKELVDRMGTTVDEIHQKFPKAHIFLVEYLALFGPETKPGRDVGFSQERIDHHRNVASVLQSAYGEVSSTRSEWCTRVPMHIHSQSNALGSKEPWVEGLSIRLLFQRGPMFHPNLKGMEAVANQLSTLIKNDK
ncbi:SGNH hydrolase-type esterase domain-containing protein [Penicillium angulare]|uniref:SGNH hydrolase-type esterase domain-containing protein n=1 Tax=Penicillium angulare TaxID=116970 RepID=A0A9W9F726_9EURO|nr:SGNH hydrolase-type esterase domain-containing protein [Penicillium angulare]